MVRQWPSLTNSIRELFCRQLGSSPIYKATRLLDSRRLRQLVKREGVKAVKQNITRLQKLGLIGRTPSEAKQ
jgi:hypothetical protein